MKYRLKLFVSRIPDEIPSKTICFEQEQIPVRYKGFLLFVIRDERVNNAEKLQ